MRTTNFVPRIALVLLFALAFDACAQSSARPRDKFLRYEIVATHPHDVAAFTQGLVYVDGQLAEGTGLHGRSSLSLRDLRSGAVLKRRTLAAAHFGEGVAFDGRRFVQLTWRSGLALIYDAALAPRGTFAYEGEGWGLAFDGGQWIMSDGSDRLTLRDRETFAVRGQLRVRDGPRGVSQLNELEYAGGRLYANVWRSDRVAVIDPASGAVRAWIDFALLRRGFARPAGWDEDAHVLNGIAHNPANGHFFVTGKCWPVLYELRLLSNE